MSNKTQYTDDQAAIIGFLFKRFRVEFKRNIGRLTLLKFILETCYGEIKVSCLVNNVDYTAEHGNALSVVFIVNGMHYDVYPRSKFNSEKFLIALKKSVDCMNLPIYTPVTDVVVLNENSD